MEKNFLRIFSDHLLPGLKLRQKETAKKYLVEGSQMGDDVPLCKKYNKAKMEKEQKREEELKKKQV